MATDQPTTPQDFAQLYEGAVNKDNVSALAKATAEKVLLRLTSIKPYTATLAILKSIQEASAAHDIPEVVRLSARLDKVKGDEDADMEKLAQVTSDFKFESLLSVYSEELKSLAYEIALIVINTAEEAKAKGRNRSRGESQGGDKPKPTFIIKKGDQSIEVMRNTGRPALPGVDKDFYEFMGFQVSQDGKSLTPESFPDNNGNRVTSLSRKVIINDMLSGNKHWIGRGYTVTEKPAEAQQAPQTNDHLRAVS
jgi:hypothetical protein